MSRNVTKTISLVGLFFTMALGSSSSIANEFEWKFNTLYGQLLTISFSDKDLLFKLKTGDITQVVASCSGNEYKVCFRSDVIDIAIPTSYRKIRVGDSWTVASTKFTLENIIDSLVLLDKSFQNVLVIDVLKTFGEGEIQKRHRQFTLFYSYDAGLIAFKEVVQDYDLPIFISSEYPSLN